MTYTNLEISELAYSRPLTRALGTFFNHLSDDREYFSRLCQVLVESYTEVWSTLGVMSNQASADTADIVYRERFRKVSVYLSEARIGFDLKMRVKLPAGITSAKFVMDKLEHPLVLWVEGIDFSSEQWGDDYWLVFSTNPFLSDFEVNTTLADDNTVANQSVELWLAYPATATYPLAEQWGEVFGLQPTTEDQKACLLQLFKSMATGPSSIRLMIGTGRAYGHPVCEKDQEIVAYVITDRRGKAVITDQSVYRFPLEAEILVEANDVLSLGQPISSAIQWYDLTSGVGPDIDGLAISAAELGSEYQSDLIFPNEDKEMLVTSQADKTKVQVELGGNLEDQQTFWDEVHTRGVAGGRTLANFLDTRPNPVGEPTSSDLPTTMNPYELLVSQALCYHTVLGVLDYSQGLLNSGSLFLARWQKLMPSHQAIHVLSILAGDTGSFMNIFSNPSDPQMGLVMSGDVGYYGIGPYSSAAGEPEILEV